MRLKEVVSLIAGGTPSRQENKYWNNGNISWLTIGDFSDFDLIIDTKEKITQQGLDNSTAKLLPVGSVVISIFATIGRIAILGRAMATNQAIVGLTNYKNCLPKYIQYVIWFNKSQLITNSHGTSQKNINSTILGDMKIPLPPLNLQAEMVKEIEIIETKANVNRSKIERLKAEIEEEVVVLNEKGYTLRKISDLTFMNPSKNELRDVDENLIVSFVEMASVTNSGKIELKVDRPLTELRKGSYKYFRENDLIIAKITPCMENGKCALAQGLTNGIGMGSSEFHVIRAKNELNPKYLFTLLNRPSVRDEAAKVMTGASGHRRVPSSYYENFLVPVPTKDEQEKFVAHIEKIEAEIDSLVSELNNISNDIEQIVKKYLE